MLVIQAMNPIKTTPHAAVMVVHTNFEVPFPLRRSSTNSPEGRRMCFTRSLLGHSATRIRAHSYKTNSRPHPAPTRRATSVAVESLEESVAGRAAEPKAGRPGSALAVVDNTPAR